VDEAVDEVHKWLDAKGIDKEAVVTTGNVTAVAYRRLGFPESDGIDPIYKEIFFGDRNIKDYDLLMSFVGAWCDECPAESSDPTAQSAGNENAALKPVFFEPVVKLMNLYLPRTDTDCSDGSGACPMVYECNKETEEVDYCNNPDLNHITIPEIFNTGRAPIEPDISSPVDFIQEIFISAIDKIYSPQKAGTTLTEVETTMMNMLPKTYIRALIDNEKASYELLRANSVTYSHIVVLNMLMELGRGLTSYHADLHTNGGSAVMEFQKRTNEERRNIKLLDNDIKALKDIEQRYQQGVDKLSEEIIKKYSDQNAHQRAMLQALRATR
jgi:hypothetical protein